MSAFAGLTTGNGAYALPRSLPERLNGEGGYHAKMVGRVACSVDVADDFQGLTGQVFAQGEMVDALTTLLAQPAGGDGQARRDRRLQGGADMSRRSLAVLEPLIEVPNHDQAAGRRSIEHFGEPVKILFMVVPSFSCGFSSIDPRFRPGDADSENGRFAFARLSGAWHEPSCGIESDPTSSTPNQGSFDQSRTFRLPSLIGWP